MPLEKILETYKNAILKRWFEAVAQTYPAETARFLQGQQDPFANPVGGATRTSLEGIFDQLAGDLAVDMDIEAIAAHLDPVIRIRAVQSFSPSAAVGFVFFLKKILKEELGQESRGRSELLNRLDARIDDTALVAFNIYMKCREKVFQLQSNEMRNRTFSAFQRAGLVRDVPEDDPDKNNPIE